jgi:hypothetical protein
MYPHRIRLRGPWECEPLGRYLPHGSKPELAKQNLPAPRRMTLPCRWDEGGLKDFAGQVRYTRDFGYPSRIDSHEHLWLTFEGADARAEVWLNGEFLGRHEGALEPFEFEVTTFLRPRNQLVVAVDSMAANGGLWGEVALEVRCAAYLRDARILAAVSQQALVELKATGAVAGVSEEPLELFLLLNGKALTSRTVRATNVVEPFELVAKDVKVELADEDVESTSRLYKVRLDLVQGTMICYSVQQMMAFRPEM